MTMFFVLFPNYWPVNMHYIFAVKHFWEWNVSIWHGLHLLLGAIIENLIAFEISRMDLKFFSFLSDCKYSDTFAPFRRNDTETTKDQHPVVNLPLQPSTDRYTTKQQ